jgi:osmoprotectant transport system substrate-binding protein/osmoprotectant transport system permease protein
MSRSLIAVAVLVASIQTLAADRIVVASKSFNEGYLLSEVVAQLLESAAFDVERKFGLGGTLICYDALKHGDVDVYVEYTGTISQAILKLDSTPNRAALNRSLEPDGVQMLQSFGFDNTYALAMKRSRANELGISKISDIVDGNRELKVVVSHEFLQRSDGWPGLVRAYGFKWYPGGIEHGLAYQALEDGAIDVTDIYSTDGEVARYGLVVLEDDKRFFPEYRAVPLVRVGLPADAKATIDRLANSMTNAQMQAYNARVTFEGVSYQQVATEILTARELRPHEPTADSQMWRSLRHNTAVHLKLTGVALVSAIVFGILVGIAVYRTRWLSRATVYVAGLLQTVPSIALLGLMIPLLGIGTVPAITALFLYSLLPILRNTVTALATMDPIVARVAVAIGLSRYEQLRHVYLPLALPAILAGIRTAAVISIGTATLAAFIGAGGLGDPIVTGLALNDPRLILQGAIPAALLAVVTELLFEGVERIVVPRHLAASRRSA